MWTLQVPSLQCRAFHLRSLSLSPARISSHRSLGHSRRCPPQPHPEVAHLHSFMALRVSVLLPYSEYLIMFPLSPSCLLSHLGPPSAPQIAFFSLPGGIEASSFGPFSLLTFLSSVDNIRSILYSLANIHLLVSTHHACHFGPELSHSE